MALRRDVNKETRPSTPGTRRSRETQPPRSSAMMASLTEGATRCQVATSSRSAASSQTVCRQGGGQLPQLLCCEGSCETATSGAIPAASTSRPFVECRKWPSLLNLRHLVHFPAWRAVTRRPYSLQLRDVPRKHLARHSLSRRSCNVVGPRRRDELKPRRQESSQCPANGLYFGVIEAGSLAGSRLFERIYVSSSGRRCACSAANPARLRTGDRFESLRSMVQILSPRLETSTRGRQRPSHACSHERSRAVSFLMSLSRSVRNLPQSTA